ncbi:MAG TPA: hypothetical protein VF331_12655 [Polyangiales bacterium]
MKIASGDSHTCGITPDARIVCWGDGTDPKAKQDINYGQSAPPDGTFKEVSAGGVHTCAIATDDTLVCWGAGNAADPNGDRPFLGQANPPKGTFRSVTCGEAHSCAIDTRTDAVVCWGGSGANLDCFPPGSYVCGQTEPPPRGR